MSETGTDKARILVADAMSDAGVSLLAEHPAGFNVDVKVGMKPDELVSVIGDYNGLIVRSASQVTKEVLEAGQNLKIVGRAGVGVDNIHVETATQKGVVVMNTPGGNAVTAAEHAIALMLSVARRIPRAAASMQAGLWEKKKFLGTEITGKCLGVVGLGNIGRIVANRAQGLQMHVLAFDPFLSDEAAQKLGLEKVDFDGLLSRADFISIHTPLTEETRSLLNKEAFSKCKKGVVVINAARGGIVNEADLLEAIDEGIVAGAGVDVFEEEPPAEDHPFRSREEIVMTPHLGASTAEAQEKVAIQIANQIAAYFATGEIRNAVNFPPIGAELLKLLSPYIDLGERLGAFLGQMASHHGAITEVQIACHGEIADRPLETVNAAVMKGVLSPALKQSVNYVNSLVVAKDRNIRVLETKSSLVQEFTSLVDVAVVAGDKTISVSGTVVGRRYPRIVRFGDFFLEAVPKGSILVVENEDRPGVVGSLGTLLGEHSVNIARLQLGRRKKVKEAVAFLNIDSPVSDELLEKIVTLPNVLSVRQVELS